MRNITVSVDEETHRLARIRAAELDTSVSALVRDFLKNLAADRVGGTAAERQDTETEVDRRRRMLHVVIEKITANGGGLRMADNLSREELYDRARARAEAKTAAAVERQDPGDG